MQRSNTPLQVYPNPYAELDGNGMPAGVVRYDPATGRRGAVHFIGAERRLEVLEKRKAAEGRQTRYKVSFDWDFSAPSRVTHSDYHVQAIRDGLLIAATPDTAKAARLKAFTPPQQALDAAKAKAVMDWKIQYGAEPPVVQWPSLMIGAHANVPAEQPAEAEPITAEPITADGHTEQAPSAEGNA